MKRLTSVIAHPHLSFKALLQTSGRHLYMFVFLLNLFPQDAKAQNEAANWFFGGGGITFNSGSPVAFANGALNSAEGLSSISDAAGNILMYTDGLYVYNRNDGVMANGSGLLGGASSSQSAVIIRKPFSTNLYYLFTADQDAEPDGIRYSIVNMSLNGGLGDVTATKNVLLHTPATEKLTAVMHCNKRDVWIIAHGFGDNTIMSWLLTPTGLSASPVISSVGSVQDQTVIGCMKVSADGRKLAFAVYNPAGQDYVQIFDYNPSTGTASNPITITTAGNCYGVEFSPNNKYLYYTGCVSSAPSNILIYQVDLCAGSNAAIAASSLAAGGSSAGFIRTLQLGPDGKLYFTRSGQGWLGVIDFPNVAAPGCGFNINGVALSPGSLCKAGLPNFNQSFFMEEIPFTYGVACLNASFSATDIVNEASCNDPVQSLNWNFGEPGSGAANTSTLQSPSHAYATPGTYSVRLIINYLCRADTLIEPVEVNCGPQVVVNDAAICPGSCVNLQATAIGGTLPYTYTWSAAIPSGAGPHSVCPVSTTNYIVTVTDAAGMIDRDTAHVVVSPLPVPVTNSVPVACAGGNTGSATVTMTGGPYTYLWQGYPSVNAATLPGLTAGTYPVVISNAAGCQQNASVLVTQPAALTGTVITTNAGCGIANGTASVSVSGGVGPYAYVWTGFTGSSSMHTALSSGSHTVVITDANNCSLTLTFTIGTASGPALSIQETTAVSCHGASTGSLTAMPTGGLLPYTYSWSGGQTTAAISGQAAGVFWVSVTDANACSAMANYTLLQPVAMTEQVTAQTASCGLSNGSASVTVSGAATPIQVLWSSVPAQTGLTAVGLPSGNYTAVVTDANGCSLSASVLVGDVAIPSISLSTSPASCSGGSNGEITASVLTTGTYQVSWNTGQTGTQLTGISAGTYTATVTNEAGCVATASQIVSSPAPLSVILTAVNATCGLSNGILTTTVAGGTAPYSFVWTGFPTALSSSLSNIASGAYTLTVTDAHGCSISASQTVNALTGPVVQVISQQGPTCWGYADGLATVAVSGGVAPVSLLWSNASISPSIVGLTAGTFIAVATDGNGCQGSASVTLSTPVPVSSTFTSTLALCNSANGTITLSPVGGLAPYTVAWSGPSVASGLSPTGLLTGNYTAIVSDVLGCSTSIPVVVGSQPPPQMTISALQDLQCPESTNATLEALVFSGQAPYSIVWSSGQTTFAIQNLTAGTYSATITDAAGCTVSSSHSLMAPAAWTVLSSITASTCGNPNGSIHLSVSGATGPYTYAWSNGQSGSQLNLLSSGTYAVTISDSRGCLKQETHAVNDAGGVQLVVSSQQDAMCSGQSNGSATLTTSGGTAPYVIQWPDGSTLIQRSNLLAGSYTVVVTDGNGCQSSVVLIISEPVAISGTLSTTEASCGLNNGTATVNAAGGVSPYSYLWNSGSTSTTVNAAAGVVSVEVTDALGCQQTLSGNIGTAPALVVAIQQTQTVGCPAGATGNLQATITGGVAPYSILWSDGSTGTSLSSLVSGTYSVTITDASGCTATASTQLLEPAAWNVLSSITPSTCGNPNGGVALTITGGTAPYDVNWSNAQNGTTLSAVSSGSFTATITDAQGCVFTDSYQVNDAGGLSLQVVSQTDATCFGAVDGTTTVAANGGTAPYVLSWNDGSSALSRTDLSSGTFTVTLTDANGCSTNTQVIISEPFAISGTLSTTEASCGLNNGTATVIATGGVSPFTYLWNSGSTLVSAFSLPAGAVSVQVTDLNGCQQSFSSTISSASQPVVSIFQTQPVACSAGNEGALDIQISGGVAPYFIVWSDGSTGTSLSSLISGTYSVTITDAAGCTAIASTQLLEPAAWNVQSAIIPSTCGNPNGGVVLTITGGTAPYAVNWSNGQSGTALSAVSSGSFTATITDAQGCVFTDSYQVNDAGGLSLQVISQTDATCFGAADGTTTVTANGGTAPYVYMWLDGITTFQRNDLPAGTHAVSVTDANGCSATLQVNLSEPVLLDGILSTVDGSCGLNNGSASLQPSGGTTPYFYFWSNSESTPSASALGAGAIGVLLTDAHGCQRSFTGTISMIPALQLTATVTQGISCNGLSDGSIQLSGGSNLTVNWSTGTTGMLLQNVPAGSYTAFAEDAGGCRDTVNITLTEPVLLQTQWSQTNATCSLADGSATVTASGGTLPHFYSWSTGSTAASVSALPVGPLSVVVTDAHGCQSSQSGVISSIQQLNLQPVVVTNASCNGMSDGSATAVVSGSTGMLSWSWSDGSTTSQATGLSAGTYTVQVADASGCMANQTFIVSQPASLQASVTVQSVSCFGLNDGTAQASVSGGSFPFTFIWNGQAGVDQIAGLAPGIQSLQVSDQQGCSVMVNFTITEPAQLLALIAVVPSTCGWMNGVMTGSSEGGTFPVSYSWNTGSQQAVLGGLGNGSYTLTATDAHGCQSNVTQSFQDPGAPQLSLLESANIACFGASNGRIELLAQGGTGNLTVLWSDPSLTGTIVSGLPAGSYTAVVQDALLCRDTFQLSLTQPDLLTLTLTVQEVNCFNGNDGAIFPTIVGGTLPYSYLWTNDQSTFYPASTLENIPAGNYQLQVQDQHGCSVTGTANVHQPEQLQLQTFSTPAICFGEPTGTAQVIVSGGVLPYSYQWNNGANDSQVDHLISGVYAVQITDAHNCSLSGDVQVAQPDPLVASFSGIDKLCFGESAVLSGYANGGIPPFSFLWSTGETSSQITWQANTTHYETLIVRDAHACADTVKNELVVFALPTAQVLSAQTELCAGDCITLTAEPVSGGVYSWSDSQNLIHMGQTVSFCYEADGIIGMTLQVIDIHGCQSHLTDADFLTVHPVPVIGFEPNHMTVSLLDALVHFENTTTGAVSYQWNFNPRIPEDISTAFSPYFHYTEIGEYPVSLIATNEYGCSSEWERTITVTEDFAVYFPNAFTPNSDGHNDRFMPYGVGIEESDFSLQIYNRWGQLMYETTTWGEGWDGTMMSETGKTETQSEVFVYQVLLKDFKGLLHDYRGSVTLVR